MEGWIKKKVGGGRGPVRRGGGRGGWGQGGCVQRIEVIVKMQKKGGGGVRSGGGGGGRGGPVRGGVRVDVYKDLKLL